MDNDAPVLEVGRPAWVPIRGGTDFIPIYSYGEPLVSVFRVGEDSRFVSALIDGALSLRSLWLCIPLSEAEHATLMDRAFPDGQSLVTHIQILTRDRTIVVYQAVDTRVKRWIDLRVEDEDLAAAFQRLPVAPEWYS